MSVTVNPRTVETILLRQIMIDPYHSLIGRLDWCALVGDSFVADESVPFRSVTFLVNGDDLLRHRAEWDRDFIARENRPWIFWIKDGTRINRQPMRIRPERRLRCLQEGAEVATQHRWGWYTRGSSILS